MNEKTELTIEQREDLVAYLDGELDEERTQAMERLLAQNPQARHEVDMLTRTFSLLDSLPRLSASSEFSQQTMEIVRSDASPPTMRDRAWYRNARRGIVVASWVVGLLLAGMTGYYSAEYFFPKERPELVQELPVIENLDAYSDVRNIDFLKELQKNKVFDDDGRKDEP